MATNRATIGTISHATMLAEDLIQAFYDELRRLDGGEQFASLLEDCEKLEDYETNEAYDIVAELFDALGEYAPPLCYFGAHPGDGSDYGFWPYDIDELDNVGRVDADGNFPYPDDETRECIAVNDHGNVTCYIWDSHRGAWVIAWDCV
jgi:hypothetical protein